MDSSGSRALLEATFGRGGPVRIARAPGRVNLIGEHTDYNQGYVLPFAIERRVEAAFRARLDRRIQARSEAFANMVDLELPLDHVGPRGDWSDYVIGILRELEKIGPLRRGFDVTITSDVPIGAGLSSSAALEVSLALGLAHLYNMTIEPLDLISLCQRAEVEFVGADCGVMDQYASLLAEEGEALLLDTARLVHERVLMDLKNVALLIVDSGVRRELARSAYNERRRECESALEWLRRAETTGSIRAWSDVTADRLDRVRDRMPDTLWKRARHVVTENERVLRAAEALRAGDAASVGRLLSASHASLRDDFEVSTAELDFLVRWGSENGALGARLVGAGFGGTTLHVIPTDLQSKYRRRIVEAYAGSFGKRAQVWEVRPSSGALQLAEARR